MTKVNKPGSQKSGTNNPKETDTKKTASSQRSQSQSSTPRPQQAQPASFQSATDKSKQSGKNRKPAIGGTAVTGAKSTQPREVKAATPAEQQAENYNRETRRRMQHMGTGPYSQNASQGLRDRRQKRLDKKKRRQEEVRKEVVSRGPSTNIRLGSRNTYFLVGTVAIILLIIIIALIVRHPF
jgi:cobalamin biosynthesis Mg chelatase CobN